MERIVIFGSTGMTGLCATEAAVKKGLNVRAFVRDPNKLPDELRNSVEVVKGDVLNYNDVLNAIKNTTAVVVVLGTRNDLKPTTDLSQGMKNIIKAMKELKVDIVSICLSAFLFYEPEKVPPMFKELNADHQRMLDVIKESGLKYVAILPPHIAGTKSLFLLSMWCNLMHPLSFLYNYWHGKGNIWQRSYQPGSAYEITHDQPAPSRVVSKYDLGKFLIDCLTMPEHYGKVCGICTKRE